MHEFTRKLLRESRFLEESPNVFRKAPLGAVLPPLAKAKRPKRDPNAPPKPDSRLSQTFQHLWQSAKGPELVKEHRFDPVRKWRFDFAHMASKVAIEIDGGVFTGGRHTRGKGFVGDAEKLNSAHALGWVVFRLATGMMKHPELAKILSTIADRTPRPNEHLPNLSIRPCNQST